MNTSIAHEVNQPLSGVVINANARLRWLAAEPPNLEEAREAITRIIRDRNTGPRRDRKNRWPMPMPRHPRHDSDTR